MLAVFCFLFLTLIVYMTYTEIKFSTKINKTTYNPRIIAKSKVIARGSIYDRNGLELAYTEKTDGEFQRKYPYENLYSHVIGYVNKDYTNSTMLEAAYNTELLGYDENSPFSNIVDLAKKDDAKGNDLYLTIDHELQKAANDAMGNNKGAVVALDPKTGEVLAMVSKPDFNPAEENFMQNLNDGDLYARAVNWNYPPGSTFKIISTAAIIDNGHDDETYDDNEGVYYLKKQNGETFECINTSKKNRYYHTDLKKAFTVSSNVYFAHLSTIVDIEDLREKAEDFMFNNTINFDLPVNRGFFNKGNMIDDVKYNAFIGQADTTTTPLHLALIGATIANDGVMPRPYLVAEVKSGSDTVSKPRYTDMGRIISRDTAKQIKDYMKDVVSSGIGTGSAARIQGIEVCGKTGTSTETREIDGSVVKLNHGLFVGFAPYDDPEIAICVVIENGGSGGGAAAPVFRTVMQKYFELY